MSASHNTPTLAPPSRWKRSVRGALWVACGLVAALALSLAGGALWLRDDKRLTHALEHLAQNQIQGSLTIQRAHWNPPLGLTLSQVEVTPSPGAHAVFSLEQGTAAVDWRALLRGRGLQARFVIDAVKASIGTAEQTEHHTSPLMQALQPRTARPKSASIPLSEQLENLPHFVLQPSVVRIARVDEGRTHHAAPLVENVAITLTGRSNGTNQMSAAAHVVAPGFKAKLSTALSAQRNNTKNCDVILSGSVEAGAHWAQMLVAKLSDAPLAPSVSASATHPGLHVQVDGEVVVPADTQALWPKAQLRIASTAHLPGTDKMALELLGRWQAPHIALESLMVRAGDATVRADARGVRAVDGAVALKGSIATHIPNLPERAQQWVAIENYLRNSSAHTSKVPFVTAPLSDLVQQLPKNLDVVATLDAKNHLHQDAPKHGGAVKTHLAPTLVHASGVVDGLPQLAPAQQKIRFGLTSELEVDAHHARLLDLQLKSSDAALKASAHGQRELHPNAKVSAHWQASLKKPLAHLSAAPSIDVQELCASGDIEGRGQTLFGRGVIEARKLSTRTQDGKEVALGSASVPWTLEPAQLRVLAGRLDGGQNAARLDMMVAAPKPGAWSAASWAGELHVRQTAPALGQWGLGPLSADVIFGGTLKDPIIESRFEGAWVAPGLAEPSYQVLARVAGLLGYGNHRVDLRSLAIQPQAGGVLAASGHVLPNQGDLKLAAAGNHLAWPHFDASGHARPPRHRGLFKLLAQGNWRSKVTMVGQLHHGHSHLDASGSWQPAPKPVTLLAHGKADLAELASLSAASARLGLSGHAEANIQASGTTARPEGQAGLKISDLGLNQQRLGEGPLTLSASVNDKQRFEVHIKDDASIEARVHAKRGRKQRFEIDADVEKFHAEAWLPRLHGAGASLHAKATSHMAFDNFSARPVGHFKLTQLDVATAHHQLALSAPVLLKLSDSGMVLEPLRLAGNAGSLVAFGQLNQAWAMQLGGQLNLALAAPFVPALTTASGQLGLQARVDGPQDAPAAHVNVRVLSPVLLRPRGMPMEVQIARGDVVLSPERLAFHHVSGDLQGGHYEINGGVALKEMRPTHWDVLLTGAGLPLQTSDLLLESNVKLALEGPGETPRVKGDIEIVSGRYLKQVRLRDFHFVSRTVDTQSPLALRAPWLRHVGLEIRARSPAGVDINVDAGAFAVRSTLVADVKIGGNVLNPSLGGKVQATDGKLHFPRGDLSLTQAQVDFEPTRRSPSDPTGAEINLQAEGEINATNPGNNTAYLVGLRLDGTPKSMALDLSCDQGLNRLEILSLLTTGHVNVTELAQNNQDQGKLDAALALAGSQLSEPLTRFAEDKLEQALDLQLELGAEVVAGSMRVTAAKSITRRLRLEGAYTHALTAEQSDVATRALLSLTDRLMLEGVTARDLTGNNTNASSGSTMQSNLQLKYRVVGD